METVVDQLLEIDRKARQSIDEAQHYYEDTMKEIEVERRRIADQYTRKASEHIGAVRQTEAQAQAEQLSDIREASGALESQLNGAYDRSHETWESEIFRRVTGKGAD